MTYGSGCLMVLMEVPPEHESEFNSWYDTEHLPQMLSCDGFETGRRFRSLDDGKVREYLALYDLSHPEVLQSEQFLAIDGNRSPWTRRVGRLAGKVLVRAYRDITPADVDATNDARRREHAGGVRIVMADVDPTYESDFNSWYDSEHLYEQLSFDGLFSARRFSAVDGVPKYLAIYDVDDAALIASEAYDRRTATEWTRRTTPRMRNSYRRTFERVG